MKTTDPEDELFDLVDEHDRVIGSVRRGVANKDPRLIHRAVAILVFNRKGQLFLQKRSKTKDTYPGFWTISASGHVRTGQSYRHAAVAELNEELGISDVSSLQRLGKRLIRFPRETEFVVCYRLTFDGKMSLNPEEIDKGEWFTLNRRFYGSFLKNTKISPELHFITENLLSNTP